ncbi:CLUMA_CG005754, isoform A [Clunio marinus]|uniref:CLUMA_CG005754, isoform A n=1 Tax=Clunio marinus TaxID=568069 RepID=A0A1J1I068_9DIPT|nr:CLUMA_CG005754, isoform A [Clunio marinus]
MLKKLKKVEDDEDYERQDVQQKTFTKWINHHLNKAGHEPITNLFEDLRDGHKLLALLETLTYQKHKPERGRMRVHHISNINKALSALQDSGIRMVNISSDDINNGNPKLTLGLIWLIALSFDGQKLVSSPAISGIERSLKAWVCQFTERHGLKVNDFTSSWTDGLAFLYILYETIPIKFDLSAAMKLHPIARLKMAFEIASEQLDVEPLLDPDDVHCTRPDKKSILMYIMFLYKEIHLSKHLDKENHLNDDEMDEIQLLSEVRATASDSDGETENKKAKLHNNSHDSLEKSIEDLGRLVNEPRNSFISSEANIVQGLEHHAGYQPANDEMMDVQIKSIQRPLSTATNCSVEIGDYQTAIEDVLEKLLKAEDAIVTVSPDAENLTASRAQFQNHEDFMLKLAEYQVSVGSALEEGTKLLTESSGLSTEEQNEIKHQLYLLNERWEALRIKALDKQTKVHKQLAIMQLEKVDELKNFLTTTEDRLSRMSVIGPGPDELRTQMEDHKKLQNDLEAQQSLVASLSNLVIIEDSEYFRDLEDKLVALEERWSHVVKWSAKRWESLQDLSFKWTKLAEQHRIINQWLNSREMKLKSMEAKEVVEIGEAMDRIKLLQFCKNDLKTLQTNVEVMETNVQQLSDESLSTLNIADKIEAINDRIDALTLILEVQESRIEAMGFSVEKPEPRRISTPDGWDNFEKKIAEIEGRKMTENVVENVTTIETTEKIVESEKVQFLNESIMDMVYFVDEMETTINDLHQLDLKNQLMVLEKLQDKLKTQVNDYEKAKVLLDDCKKEVNGLGVEDQHIQELGSKYDSIGFRIEDMIESAKIDFKKEKFHKTLTIIKLSLADSRDWYKQHANNASKDELDKQLKEMESLDDGIKEIKDVCDEENGSEWVEWKRDFQQFKESWNDLKNAIKRLIDEKSEDDAESIKEFDMQTEEILARVNEMEEWLVDLEKNTPTTTNDKLENLNDLFQVKSKFQVLKESCEQMTVKFREINETGSETLLQGDDLIHNKRDSNFSQLAKQLTKLISRWNDVTSKVYARTAELEHLSAQYGELKTLLVSEAGYLDKLDKLLRKSPENAADAEEISEELDDIENYLRNNSSDSRIDKIQEVGKDLVDLGFLKDEISNEIASVLDRRDYLHHQAETRIQILEKAVSEAQLSESQVSDLQQWIFRVDDLLNDFIEHDTTFECLPHDFQRLTEEFEENGRVMEEMKQQVETYKLHGKIEAANRYQDQINLLQDRFVHCQEKLEKFTSPQAIFENRLSRAIADLRNVERSCCILDVASAGSQNVHDQYQHCLKFYRKLSEVKPEIENIIKSGRQLCNETFTKDSKKLNTRIDTLKHLYNALGDTVTTAKNGLERIIRLLTQFNQSIEIVVKWVGKQKHDRMENNNIEINLSAINEVEAELRKCHQVFDEYKGIVDSGHLEDIGDRLNLVDREFNEFLNLGDDKKILNEMLETLQNIDQVPIEKLRSIEENLGKIKPKSEEIEKLHSQVQKIVIDAIEFHTKMELKVDDDMEIVILSDTVRQRRSRTPISAISNDSNRESIAVVIPNLSSKKFQSSEIFPNISGFSDDEIPYREASTRDEVPSMVEIRESNVSMKMTTESIDLDGAKVDTINIYESCGPLELEQAETVLIIDASSDTDTATSTPLLRRKSLKSLNSATGGSMDELKTELKYELDVVANFDSLSETLSVKNQRISYEEHNPISSTKDRDILLDSEISEEKALKMLKLRPTLKELLTEERNSFADQDDEYDEPLEFSDDEEIPRYSVEMDSDSDLSRIETPNNHKLEFKDKEASFSADDSFSSPLLTSSPFTYKSVTPLDQRVEQFEKTSKYMIKKLDQTLQQIKSCEGGASSVEHMKLSIAPDAALILSQGDTLILETHGKDLNLTQRLLNVQKELRDKYKDVQNSNTTNNINLLEKNHNVDPENQYSPKEKVFADKKFPLDLLRSSSASPIKLDDLVTKVLKRVKDLISKPADLSSEDDLTKRILDIGEKQEDLKFAIEFASQSPVDQTTPETMEFLEKAKKDLSSHCDQIVMSLATLNKQRTLERQQSQSIKTTVTISKVSKTPIGNTTPILSQLKKVPSDTGSDNSAPSMTSSESPKTVREVSKSSDEIPFADDNIAKKKEKMKERFMTEGAEAERRELTSNYVPGSFTAKQKSQPSVIQARDAASFENSIVQISDWLNLEMRKQILTVGDTNAIVIAIDKQKTVLRELEFKKPQLDKLVKSAESLKTDATKNQLDSKGEVHFSIDLLEWINLGA